jgi:hypothetical protein
MLDAIIVSDIHLGSSNCEAKALCSLLQSLEEQTLGGDAIRLPPEAALW